MALPGCCIINHWHSVDFLIRNLLSCIREEYRNTSIVAETETETDRTDKIEMVLPLGEGGGLSFGDRSSRGLGGPLCVLGGTVHGGRGRVVPIVAAAAAWLPLLLGLLLLLPNFRRNAPDLPSQGPNQT